MMRVLLLSEVVAVCATLVLAQGRSESLATLSGRVTANGGQAIPGARVSLSFDPTVLSLQLPRPNSSSVMADEKGGFSFSGVQPGTYILSASAAGFVRQAYGGKPGYFGAYSSTLPFIAATPVTVRAGQEISGLNLQLVRVGGISGRVTSAGSDPVKGVPVYAVRWTYMDGTRRLLEQGRATTDEQGEFRITGLAPGQFYLYGVPPAEIDRPDVIKRVAQPTFSPNATQISEALAVTVTQGTDGFADIRLREDFQYTVRGVVFAQRNRPAAGATVLLMKDPQSPILAQAAGPQGPVPRPPSGTYQAIAHANERGEFELKGVIPGFHRILAFGGKRVSLNMSSEGNSRRLQGPPETPSADDGSAGAVEITVRNGDLQSVEILLYPGTDVTSEIRMADTSYRAWRQAQFEKSSTAVPAAQRSVMLESVPGVTLIPESGTSYGGNFPTRPDSLRGFTQRVSPGRYFVQVDGAGLEYYVKAIRVGNIDVMKQPFQITSGAAKMEITLATDAVRVRGLVTDSDGTPARGAPVILRPVTPDYSRRDEGIITVISGHDGSFMLPMVPPGDYQAVAFADLPEPGLGQYPPFVSQFTTLGERITVKPNEDASVNLKVVTARAVERILAEMR